MVTGVQGSLCDIYLLVGSPTSILSSPNPSAFSLFLFQCTMLFYHISCSIIHIPSKLEFIPFWTLFSIWPKSFWILTYYLKMPTWCHLWPWSSWFLFHHINPWEKLWRLRPRTSFWCQEAIYQRWNHLWTRTNALSVPRI